jgi:voltage-gated sodium channel
MSDDRSNQRGGNGFFARLADVAESARVQRIITALIVINAVTLGLETSDVAMAHAGPVLEVFDRAILAVFVLELLTKMLGRRLAFFRSGWNIFDLLVVGVAIIPAAGALSVLRALRILRVLRLISVVPQMRAVVESLIFALPGLGSIMGVLLLLFYVSAVLATKLFGAGEPALFGTMGASLFTLFQIMTLEGWADIARDMEAEYPWAWMFFVPYILVTTFTMLNLFIAVIVNAMQSRVEAEQKKALEEVERVAEEEMEVVEADFAVIRRELAEIRQLLEKRG